MLHAMEEERMEDIVLPGFRFHPTDEELVGFYLRRKIQQKPLSIELIKQLDIYKFDPWDLPKLATTGEKEWYFCCPRDRKYRNSARPNRVTTAGFWKATGTDRPIYSSESGKCIGLKKSLVFYKGRAAKGIKTDWMMHEFRLPSAADAKKPLDKKNIPPNDSWAICRIFKKTSSMAAQRALSHSWAAQLPEPSSSDIYYSSCCNVDVSQPSVKEASTACSTSHLNAISSTPTLPPAGFCFSPIGCNPDMASILMNLPPALVFGDQAGRPPTTIDFSQNIESCTDVCFIDEGAARNNVGGISHPGGHHWQASFSLAAPPGLVEAWRAGITQWDSMPCPSEIPAGYVAKCYT